jgi:demethylmenaquinone methyltransferase/2-methoxy-6-polyprenyl-1,4-benzoquinol methylase
VSFLWDRHKVEKKVLEIVAKSNGYYFRYRRYRDLAILMTQTNAKKLLGLDISAGMLEVGKKNCRKETV